MGLYEDMLKVAAERGLEALNEEIQREKAEEGSENTDE